MDISAIIPTYNHMNYLGEAIESVLGQTQPVKEIIVVDDGSTDRTRELVACFGDRVRYIYQTNRGLASARNRGVREARGEWVAFLDADDWWLPEKVRRLEEALLEKPHSEFFYHTVWWVLSDGSRKLNEAVEPALLWPALRLSNTIAGSGSSVTARREILMAEGFDENLRVCEDWDLWVRLYKNHHFTAVQEPLGAIRIIHGSMSLSKPERMIENTELILEKTLLQGLEGWSRNLWRRRIRATALFNAAMTARTAVPQEEWGYLWKSFVQWPNPFFCPTRWFAVLRNLIGPERFSQLSGQLKSKKTASIR